MQPDRPPLVLLHGWGMHGGVFAPLAEALRQLGWEVHTPDLAGHGHRAAEGFTDLDTLCRSVADELPPRCILGGWSLGSLVALRLAALLTQRIEGLLLLHATPCFQAADDWPHGMDRDTLQAFAEALAQSPTGTFERFLALQARGDMAPRDTLRWLREAVTEGGMPGPDALAAGLRVLAVTDLRRSVPGIRQACLVVGSEGDGLTPPEASRWLAAQLPSARLALLADVGHTGALRRATEVAALVDRTLVAGPAGVAA